MPKNIVVCINLEYTLFGYMFTHSETPNLGSHLSPFKFDNLKMPDTLPPEYIPANVIKDVNGNFFPTFHAIYKNQMAIIFKAILAAEYKIVLITHSGIDRDLVITTLERLYELPPLSLNNVIYIKDDDYGNRDTTTVVKILRAQEAGVFGDKPIITLIDDDLSQIDDAKNIVLTIHATGQQDPRTIDFKLAPSNPNYLFKIVNSLALAQFMSEDDKTLFTSIVNIGAKQIRNSIGSDSSVSTILLSPGITSDATIAAISTATIPEDGEDDGECCDISCFRRKRLAI